MNFFQRTGENPPINLSANTPPDDYFSAVSASRRVFQISLAVVPDSALSNFPFAFSLVSTIEIFASNRKNEHDLTRTAFQARFSRFNH
jgi:hypothetical protein